MSDATKKEDAFFEERESNEILKEIDEAVKRIIEYYHNEENIATNLQDDEDIQLLAKHPRAALKSFYKILEVDKQVPYGVPSHPSNNSNFSSKLAFPSHRILMEISRGEGVKKSLEF